MRARFTIVLLAATAAGCFVRDLEGKPCDDEHACIDGFVCSDGACLRPAHVADAGAARADAGDAPDGGMLDDDGGALDAGGGLDAGSAVDAGAVDDAGAVVDAGAVIDDGGAADAGVVDAGAVVDTGVVVDAGVVVDTGVVVVDGGPCGAFDEDGDGVNDGCDNCPDVANANQLDIGEAFASQQPDGVGDSCDPHPILPGDSIAFFDGFHTLDAAWSASGAGVVHVGDEVELNAAQAELVLARTDVAAGDVLVVVRGRHDLLPQQSSGAGAFARWTNNDGSGCVTRNDGKLSIVDVDINGTGGNRASMDLVTSVAPDVAWEWRLEMIADDAECTAGPDDGGAGTSTTVSRTMVNANANGGVGLIVDHAEATFSSIIVYEYAP